MTAANKRILTRRSSNCSRTSCHKDFPSSAGNSAKIMRCIIANDFMKYD